MPANRADDLLHAIAARDRSLLVVDVEATCWRKGVFSRKKETIEIGAVLWRPESGPSTWPEFQTFVRPARLPRLSSFCRELTGISQQDIDAAPGFPEALARLFAWSPPLDQIVLASWSRYDVWQLDLDLEACGLPTLACPVLDVKTLAARLVGRRSFDEAARTLAPECETLPRHRAIADARRTARILDRLLRPHA
jgi:inhibitor of KinA sporulation pathway (predicted exonuclease)